VGHLSSSCAVRTSPTSCNAYVLPQQQQLSFTHCASRPPGAHPLSCYQIPTEAVALALPELYSGCHLWLRPLPALTWIWGGLPAQSPPQPPASAPDTPSEPQASSTGGGQRGGLYVHPSRQPAPPPLLQKHVPTLLLSSLMGRSAPLPLPARGVPLGSVLPSLLAALQHLRVRVLPRPWS
jgi:hypothetical protein